jgi:repressor LexA
MDQTETVERVYAFIKAYIREHTYPPTMKEIAEGCYMSRSGVARYVDRLQGMGRISRDPSLARGITLLGDKDDE